MEKKVNDELDVLLNNFKSIDLTQLPSYIPSQRIDVKFLLNPSQFLEILKNIIPYYQLISIGEKKYSNYKSTYWDTIDKTFYFQHHNGILPRFKLRTRTYLDSDISFLEIKSKNKKGINVKNRFPLTSKLSDLDTLQLEFISKHISNISQQELRIQFDINFTRLAFVNQNTGDRLTFDWDVKFYNSQQNLKLDDLIVAELKQNIPNKNSDFLINCKKLNLRSVNFSKYCVGMSLLNPQIKHNNFKPILNKIKNGNI